MTAALETKPERNTELTVGKKRQAKGAQSAPQTPKPERARDRGEVVPFTFEMPTVLNQALEICAEKERRTKKAVLTLALEEYLLTRKLWPPGSDRD